MQCNLKNLQESMNWKMRNDLLDQHRTLSQNSKCCIHCRNLSMPCPGNISKLERHTATCRQHTVVRPCMVGTEPSMHYISILLSQRIIPICQSGINLSRNRHSAIFERRTNHCLRTIVAWWQIHMSWNKICYLSTEKVILLFFHKLLK